MNKVLIIDDEIRIREMLGLFLSKKYEVLLAADGQEALAVVKEQCPDFIITDVNMPNMNGDEFSIHMFEINPLIPIVVMSGIDANRDKKYSSNVVQFIEKPFKVQTILDLMTTVLAK